MAVFSPEPTRSCQAQADNSAPPQCDAVKNGSEEAERGESPPFFSRVPWASHAGASDPLTFFCSELLILPTDDLARSLRCRSRAGWVAWALGPLFPIGGAAHLLSRPQHRCFQCSFLGARSPVARQLEFPANCCEQLAPQTRLPGTRRPAHPPGDSAASARGPYKKGAHRSQEPPPDHLHAGPRPAPPLWDATPLLTLAL